MDADLVRAYEELTGMSFQNNEDLRQWFFSTVGNNGAGASLNGDTADIAFVGAVLDILPRLFDTVTEGDGVVEGFLQSRSLTETLAPDGAMATDRDEGRNTAVINRTELGRQFRDAYQRLQARATPSILRPHME